MENKPIGKRRITSRKKVTESTNFYLIEPIEGSDATKVVDRLIKMKSVEEVYLADGDYGFLVKSKHESNDEELRNFLNKKNCRRYGAMTAYYGYKK
jgi:DNA-binding Lrp family transcriptional regulator